MFLKGRVISLIMLAMWRQDSWWREWRWGEGVAMTLFWWSLRMAWVNLRFIQLQSPPFTNITDMHAASTQEDTGPTGFEFLLQAWCREEEGEVQESGDMIDEMNKKMRVIQQQIDRITALEREEKSVTAQTAGMVQQSYEYRQLQQQHAKEIQQLRDISERHRNEKEQKERYHANLIRQVERLREENRQLSLKYNRHLLAESQLCSSMDKLTQEIIDKDKTIFQLKHKGMVKKFINKEACLEVTVRQTHSGIDQRGKYIEEAPLERTLQEVISWLQSQQEEDSFSIQEALNTSDLSVISLNTSQNTVDPLSDFTRLSLTPLNTTTENIPPISTSSLRKRQHPPKNRSLLFSGGEKRDQLMRFVRGR